MATTAHEILGGKVQVFQRDKSPFWWCSASVAGQRFRASTKEEGLQQAKAFAEDWFLELKGKNRWGGGVPTKKPKGVLFTVAADRFLTEFEVITQGRRSPIYVQGHRDRVNNHLIPFFGKIGVEEITSGILLDYRVHRLREGRKPRWTEVKSDELARARGEEPPARQHVPLSRSALHQEIVCLRQILKTAHRHGWLPMLPDMSLPFKEKTKITHRAWFSPDEYKRLRDLTRDLAREPTAERYRSDYQNLHDTVLFLVNTGLRPDEALRLEYRDVDVVTDNSTGERILEIEVRGKRGIGYCKSMPGAVMPFQRLLKRADGQPTDNVFPVLQRNLFNLVLDRLDLKRDREGQVRTFYSLRHTYICLRLMEGADIYQIAKNCRTSVEMIEEYYASHIKNVIDASAVNVRKGRLFPKNAKAEKVKAPLPTVKRSKSRSTAKP
ncbi:tyrosine-type recombinase/integrase [Caulobacter sp. DWP3-1-3b2]|uniref:tyrosine-type recombinase/integrase n=1 Tax=Caulobacter sp. DWP3-1-3b2 TaxID=2804643 RepID=UPI003CF905D8